MYPAADDEVEDLDNLVSAGLAMRCGQSPWTQVWQYMITELGRQVLALSPKPIEIRPKLEILAAGLTLPPLSDPHAPRVPRGEPIVKPPKIGRNELCPCGTRRKYKHCCNNRR